MIKGRSIPQNSFKLTLSIFSGEEKEYVRRSERKARIMFAAIGSFVILIFLGCMLSAYFFFDSLIEGVYAVSLPVGFFWGLLVVNMYLLLLYTVSPTILPHKKNKAGTDNGLFTFSMFLRVGFMSLLAVITAQPLNVEVFSKSVANSLNRHIQEEKAAMIISSDSYIVSQEIKDFKNFEIQQKLKPTLASHAKFQSQISAVRGKILRDSLFVKQAKIKLDKLLAIEAKIFKSKKEKALQELLLKNLEQMIQMEIQSDKNLFELLRQTSIGQSDFINYKEQLSSALATKLKNYSDLDDLLSSTNFYIKRVQLIFYENPWSWLATFVVCFLFIVPIILKYKVRKYTNYYHERIELERQDVVSRYEVLKSVYCQILKSNISQYNFSSLQRLEQELEKLKQFDYSRYRKIRKEIKAEYQEEVFSKYEYWADNPFRTLAKAKPRLITQPPVALMDFVYDDSQNDS